MAITVAAKLAQKLLKNKKLKKAINGTTEQTNKLKNAAKVTASGAAAKVSQAGKDALKKAKPVAEKAKEKVKEVSKKVADKTPKGVKEVVKKTATGAAIAGGGIAAAGGLGGSFLGGIAGAPIGKGIRAATNKVREAMGKPVKKQTQLRKDTNEMKDTVLGGVVGGTAGAVGALAGTAALTASMLKSTTPKESEYDIKRLTDGRFSTTFKDASRNAVFSSKQLSEKDINDVRKNLAVLESVVLSTSPSYLEKQEFMARLNYLNDKYGITNITGKNLSILIPQV
jgi:hypothetical protein